MTLLDSTPSTDFPTTHSPRFDEQDTIMNPSAPTGRSVLLEPREPDSTSPPGREPERAPVARCADGHGTMTGLFFSDNVVDIARAKAMCGLVPSEGLVPRRRPRTRGAVGRVGR